MNEIIYFLILLIGFCSSLVGSLLGAGGGFLNVPFFIFIGYSEYSTTISLFAVAINGITASIFNIKKKLVDFKISVIYIPSAIIGGILGAYIFNLFKFIDINIFKLIFTIFLVILGIKVFIKEETELDQIKIIKIEELNRKFILFGILIGLITGFFGSFLGIGGGLFSIPASIFIFNVSTHVAIATSLFLMVFTAISGLITHSLQGYLPDFAIFFGIFLAIGAVFGANIGSRLAYRLKGKKIRKIYGIIMVGVAIPLTWLRVFIPINDPIQIIMKELINFFSNFSI
ncbi:MAG: sulfite exporter TauE/SafE family protein [Promethearchaeota archaeon]